MSTHGLTLRNGRRILGAGGLILDPEISYDVVTKTDDYTVLVTDSGRTLVMNSTGNKTFTLPSVGAGDVGLTYTFININTGRLTIQAADSDIIDDSSAGGTAYSDDDNNPTYTIRLASTTRWETIGANGTWTTT